MQKTGNNFGRDLIQYEGQNKIMFFYTVQFVDTFNITL